MPDKHLYEYAVIRIVPRVEREEFLNAGIILYCNTLRFLAVQCTLNKERLQCFAPDLPMEEIEARLQAFQQVCAGGKGGGPIGQLPLASRFRWLTALRSTTVQTSRVHPGFCTNAQETLEGLFQQLVL